MRKLSIALSIVLLLASACNNEKNSATTGADRSAVAKADAMGTPVDTAAMNKAWAAYMAPGKVHQMLAKADGKWDAEISFYASLGQPPVVNKATCENRMILGGRISSLFIRV